VYSVFSLTINSGDFVVGLRIDHGPNELPGALDTNSGSKRRSYYSSFGTPYVLVDTLEGLAGNWGIRAQLEPQASSLSPARFN